MRKAAELIANEDDDDDNDNTSSNANGIDKPEK